MSIVPRFGKVLYKYKENLALKILKFSKMNEEWLNFLVDCNYGKKHSYDIVEGLFLTLIFVVTLKIF